MIIIASSSHFEIAIATAISMKGAESKAALGTTMGLFWEVPIMLSLVYLLLHLKKINYFTYDSDINKNNANLQQHYIEMDSKDVKK